MDTKLRKQIEWHFYNYESDKKLGIEEVDALVYEGITPNYESCPSRSQRISNPTQNKALNLDSKLKCYLWSKVVENTYGAFRFEPEYNIMIEIYLDKKKPKEIIGAGFNESTFWYWRDRWLECAFMWAQEYKLM